MRGEPCITEVYRSLLPHRKQGESEVRHQNYMHKHVKFNLKDESASCIWLINESGAADCKM